MRHMQFASFLLSAVLLEGGVASAASLKYASGCAQPPTTTGHVFYIDPVHGSATGDGSQAHPWNSLQSITATNNHYPQTAWQPSGCSNNSGCTSGPLLATQAYNHYNPAQKKYAVTVNANAPIKAGDTIALMTGNYGDVSFSGVHNSSFITITPASGAAPVVSSLKLVGGQKWIVKGVKFRSRVGGYSAYINVSGNSSSGASSDVILDSNDIAPDSDISGWSAASWTSNIRFYGIVADGGDQNSTYAKCITITNNMLQNLRNGMSLMANNSLVDGNTIDNFGDDGIDYAASNLVLSNNKITNSRNLGDGNHNDAMQGQIGRGVTGTTFNNIMINGNIIIAQTAHAKPLTFPGDLQGIDAFDMNWSNITAINNVVITNLYHGIAFYSLHGGLIANNTVLSSSNKGTWIGVFDKSHQGTSSNNVIVRNNITSVLDMDSPASTLTADHNLAGQEIVWTTSGKKQWLTSTGTYTNQNVIDPKRLTPDFKAYDPVHYNYDVHLMPGTLAVGTGTIQLAPLTATGVARKAPVDLGAYPLH